MNTRYDATEDCECALRPPAVGRHLLARGVVAKCLVLLFALIAMPLAAMATPFTFQNVIAQAEQLARRPYQRPPTIPKFFRRLDYGIYKQIKLKPKYWLWNSDDSRFRIGPISAGYLFDHPVKLQVVDQAGVHAVRYAKDQFTYPTKNLFEQIPANLGYAGFQVGYAFGAKHTRRHSFLVFLGASYFRGIGDGQVYGASARGIAVNTGLPSGEQFPRFTQYWLVRPRPNSNAMKFYALLNGKSLTGAYRFVVYPGKRTYVRVKAVVFTRRAIKRLGIAPLTSMFLFGANTRQPADNWRPQVHDSDGLLIHNGTGEWLWHPLRDPLKLRTDYFSCRDPKGFGLFQRGTQFSLYQSLSARYDKRPSLWVKPSGDWGKGHVILLQIPNTSNNNDNIDAFWIPSKEAGARKRLTFSYTLAFGGPGIADESMAHAAWTRIGITTKRVKGGGAQHVYHVVVEFSGGYLDTLGPNAAVVAAVTPENGTTVQEQYVQYVAPLHQWRLNIIAAPGGSGHGLQLRAYLRDGKQALTETWTYQLPHDNHMVNTASNL